MSRRQARAVDDLPLRSDQDAPAALRLYLKEMSITPLLGEAKEFKLASQLNEARSAIARLAASLPGSCREHVLAGDELGPSLGADWPLSRLERFYGRLVAYAANPRCTCCSAVLIGPANSPERTSRPADWQKLAA